MPGWDLTLICAVLIVAAPVLTLIHELGQAVAARLLGVPITELAVGDSDDVVIRAKGVTFRFGRSLDQHAPGGFVTFDPERARARDVVVIALAGPLADLAVAAALIAAARLDRTGGLADLCLWPAGAAAVVMGVANLIPIGTPDGTKLLSDGRIAQLAWAAHRGRPIEIAAPPAAPAPEPAAPKKSAGMRWPFKAALLLVAGAALVAGGPVMLLPLIVIFGGAWLTGADRHKLS